jgi:AAA domain/IclR helix-turn-helix domain
MSDTRAATAAYVEALLRGSPPNGAPPEAFGGYRDVIENLVQAHAHGGTAKVRQAWNGTVQRHPELASLVSADPAAATRKVSWTAGELLAAEFPPGKWVASPVLTEGLAVLAGRPKLGKSWLALQIAQAVASGGRAFDEPVEQGAVLYIALEDNARRLQRRLQLQQWPASAMATFHTSWSSLDAGGLTTLQRDMETWGYRLVIIDTLSRALSARRNQNEMAEMIGVFSPLQCLALECGTAILLVDHHSKPKGTDPDPVDDVLGSTAKGAAADIVMGLYRKRGEQGATLRVVGRDLDADHNLALEWDPRWCCWHLLGDAAEGSPDTLDAQILAVFAALGGEATTTQVAQHLGKDKGNISRAITTLVEQGKLERGPKRGKEQFYRLPGTANQEASPHHGRSPVDDALDLHWDAGRRAWQWEGETTAAAAQAGHRA